MEAFFMQFSGYCQASFFHYFIKMGKEIKKMFEAETLKLIFAQVLLLTYQERLREMARRSLDNL